jgi:hypothetical protein
VPFFPIIRLLFSNVKPAEAKNGAKIPITTPTGSVVPPLLKLVL